MNVFIYLIPIIEKREKYFKKQLHKQQFLFIFFVICGKFYVVFH